MAYDVEEELAVAMRQCADHDVDARALLEGALLRGRRMRRGRRVAMVLGGVAVAGITATTILASPLMIGQLEAPEAGTTGTASAEPGRWPVPGLPDPDAGGAIARPDQVGKDPSTIHFALETVPLPLVHTSWSVRETGVEALRLTMKGASGQEVTADVSLQPASIRNRSASPSASADEVDIAGRPGTLTRSSPYPHSDTLTWSPADGIEAAIFAVDLEKAHILELGHTLRLTGPPAVPPRLR
jgi:hypothetical protein